jgi:nucleoside-diphosphate-sugar epimerase
MSAKVLLVGGTQFIGHHIASALLKAGHRVTLLHRGQHKSELGARAEEVMCDWHDEKEMNERLKKRSFDAVVHCICFTEHEAALSHRLFADRCGHFIYFSTAAVYLMNPEVHPPFREEDALREPAKSYLESEKFSYGVNKRKADLFFLLRHTRNGFPATIFRLPVVTGPRDYTGRLAAYLHRVRDGKPILMPDGGHNTWGFLAAEDIGQAVLKCLRNKKTHGKVYNLAQREAVSLRNLVLALGRLSGHHPCLVDIPSIHLVKTRLGIGFSPLSSSHHVLLDCSAAQRDFGFAPTPFLSWLKGFTDAFKKEGARDLFRSTRALEVEIANEYMKDRFPY